MPYSGGGISVSSANTWTANQTFSGQVRISDGTAAEPGLVFTSDDDGSGTGLYLNATGEFTAVANGVEVYRVTGAGPRLRLQAAGLIGWSSTSALTSSDTVLTRDSAATLQMGSDVNGAPTAQALKAHDGITGTDIAGANLTLAGGRGTGAGAGGNVILQAAPALATGTTAQTLADRQVIVGKAKALTAAAATGFARVACAQGTVVGGFVCYSIEANDGTDYQCRSGVLPFAIVNKAGTETGTVGTVGAATEVVAVSAGTLTNTFTIASNAADTMDLSANAASSLTETTLRISYQVFLNAGTGVVTPL